MSWEAVLTSLGGDGEWTAPEGLGPLPAESAARGREVLSELASRITELEDLQAQVGRALAALAGGHGERRPACYLDTVA